IEENGQVRTIRSDGEIFPGIELMHTPAHTPGGLTVLVNTPGGKAAITGFCVIMENFHPPREVKAMEMEVIPPGTLLNPSESYDILLKVKEKADILIPLHEPRFAGVETIP
ncbi:MAG: N-acyl homoserine lactonase family protein, partial [Deltaproteobacteria bacterium]